MRFGLALLPLFVVTALSYPVCAQQAPASSPQKPGSAAGNLEIPRSEENFQALTDLKTGLKPGPPVPVQNDEQPDFARDMIRLQWRDNDSIELWVIRPKVAGKVVEKTPVILYLYSYPDSGDRFRDNGWCRRATADGFAAVGFVGALTDYRFQTRPLKEWFVSQLPEALGSTTHDVQLILNYLAERGDLDMDHIGMFGMGSGGAIAILAAQADPRISTIDILDPWGDWPDWLKNSPAVPANERAKYLTKEFLSSVAPLDPLSYLPVLHTPSIRLQQTVSEPVTPSIAKEAIASAAPDRATIVRYQTPEDLLKAWKVAGLSGWIKQQLRRPEDVKATAGLMKKE